MGDGNRHNAKTCNKTRNLSFIFGGADRDRTDDLVIANDALSQLSYGPIGA